MRNLVLLLSILFFSVQIATAQQALTPKQVEQAISKTGKYAILVNTAQHLKAAIKTRNELKGEHKEIEFHIVMCGGVIKELSSKPELQQMVTKAVNQNLTMLVCGMTLRNLNISAEMMPKEALLTENGLTYTFGLMELGFKVIAL